MVPTRRKMPTDDPAGKRNDRPISTVCSWIATITPEVNDGHDRTSNSVATRCGRQTYGAAVFCE